MRLINALGIFFLVSTQSHAALIGTVDEVRNLPGYIELNPNSSFYEGALSKADRNDSIERRTPSQIISEMFKDKKFLDVSIRGYVKQIDEYLAALYLVNCQEEVKLTSAAACDRNTEFQKKWAKDSHHKALAFARSNFLEVMSQQGSLSLSKINTPEHQPLTEKLFTAIEIWEAVKGEDEQASRWGHLARSFLKLKSFVSKDFIGADGPEASNLLVPSSHALHGTQTFFSEEQLSSMKVNGADLSLLDPPSTGLWRKPKQPISEFDTANYNQSGLAQLRKLYSETDVQRLIDPQQEISLIYRPHELDGGQTPKFDVSFGKHKWKFKFITNRADFGGAKTVFGTAAKFLWGSEVNVESVANNLAAAIGFTVDPTYFKKKVRIYFDDSVYQRGEFDQAHAEMIAMLDHRYPGVINVRSALEVVRTDEQGKRYIEVKSITMEQKSHPDTDMNVGFFDRTNLGKDLSREHRASALFYAWIGDPDIKNDNNKVKLVPHGDGYKIMHSLSDMGGGFGLGFPNIYNYPLIKYVQRDKNGNPEQIQLNWWRVYPFPLNDALTINDIKWFSRLLGQLTLEQLERAFVSSGYPLVVAKYYALLAAGKRNELLKAVNLIGTEYVDAAGKKQRFALLPEFTGTIQGYEQYFVDGRLTDPSNSLYRPDYENWVRHWGTRGYLFSSDPDSQKEFRKAIRNSIAETTFRLGHSWLDGAVISKQRGFNIMNPRIIDHRLGVACENDCFAQGFDFGLRNFVPARFLIENPHANEDPRHPLLIVDIMRLGYFVGDQGEMFQRLLGFNVSSNVSFAFGTRVFRIHEIVKVTPIAGIENFFDHLDNFIELPRYPFRGLRDRLVDDLQNNESLIVTTYQGVEQQSRLRAPTFPFSLPSFRFGDYFMNLGRTTIKKHNGQFYANWTKENIGSVFSNLNLIDFFIFRYPVASFDGITSKTKDKTFVFNDNLTDKGVLLDSLGHSNTKNIPPQYWWEHRKMHTRTRKVYFSGFTKSYRHEQKKQKIDYVNFREMYERHIKKMTVAREYVKQVDIEVARWKKKAEVLIDEDHQMSVLISFDMYYPAAKRSDFLNVIESNLDLFPKNIFFFDRNKIKHYMGDVTVRSRVLYTQEMLDKIFDPSLSRDDVCFLYNESIKKRVSCDSIQFSVFYGYYQRAKHYYESAKVAGLEAKFKHMKQVGRFFMAYDYLKASRFAKFVVGEANVIEAALFMNSTGAFPGDHEVMKIENNESRLSDRRSTLQDETSIFSDDLNDALKSYQYNPNRQRPLKGAEKVINQ